MSLNTNMNPPADAVAVFAALADSTRLSLLKRLQDGHSHAIVELTDGTGLTRQAISKHLQVLQSAGLVTREKTGRESRYIFDVGGVHRARAYLDMAAAQWDAAAVRLKDFVEAS